MPLEFVWCVVTGSPTSCAYGTPYDGVLRKRLPNFLDNCREYAVQRQEIADAIFGILVVFEKELR